MPAASGTGQAFAARALGRLKSYTSTRSGWRRAFLAFAAGSISVLAFAPFFAWPVFFLTFPVLIWLIAASTTPAAAAIAAWWFGFGYFFFNLVWIGEAFLVEAEKFAWLLPFAVTLLPAGLALFWAAAGWILKRIDGRGLARVIAFAIVISAAEWVRGHVLTGLPWDVPGYALTVPAPLMQGAGLFGIYGLTFIACIVFSTPFVLASETETNRAFPLTLAVLFAAVPLALLYAYGALRLQTPAVDLEGVRIRIVQPSVPQREKWLPEFQRRIFDDHLALSRTNANGVVDDLAGITHVIWPEAAMPFFPLETPEALAEIAQALPEGRLLITGAIRHGAPTGEAASPYPPAFNSILVFDDQAKLTGLYDKIHLVPFGEYLPVESVLAAIGLEKLTYGRGGFSSGPAPRPLLKVPGLPPVAGLICYEALFPGEVMQTADRPGVLLNVTNDGWFGNSTGPRQHFHQARVRAVEQGVALVRAANNGISAIVDPFGRVVQRLDMNVRGVIDGGVPRAVSPPPYARWGDWIFSVLEVLATAYLVFLMRRVGH